MTLTADMYTAIDSAFNYFNQKLFNNELPIMVFTLHRKKNARGYFWSNQFRNSDNEMGHEIALNPETFKDRSDIEILSTFVHEMVHPGQECFGKPSKGSYHNSEWAKKMEEIGLMPSTTAAEGGKKTGNKVSHYIIENGKFNFIAKEFISDYGKKIFEWRAVPEFKLSKANNSRVRYECTDCGKSAYAKPETALMCGDCLKTMEEL